VRLAARFLLGFLFFFSINTLNAASQNLTQITIEELMNTEVISVTGIARPLSQSAAAVTVISSEDIRGPGATIWGSNAVNGVINIITKDTQDTKGEIIKGHGGSEEHGGAMSYSGKVNEKTTYRAYGKTFHHSNSYHGNDSWYLSHGGLRIDSKLNEKILSLWTTPITTAKKILLEIRFINLKMKPCTAGRLK